MKNNNHHVTSERHMAQERLTAFRGREPHGRQISGQLRQRGRVLRSEISRARAADAALESIRGELRCVKHEHLLRVHAMKH